MRSEEDGIGGLNPSVKEKERLEEKNSKEKADPLSSCISSGKSQARRPY